MATTTIKSGPPPPPPHTKWKTLFFHPDAMADALDIATRQGWEVFAIVECKHTLEHAAYLKRTL